jgi:hypothetical protein
MREDHNATEQQWHTFGSRCHTLNQLRQWKMFAHLLALVFGFVVLETAFVFVGVGVQRSFCVPWH